MPEQRRGIAVILLSSERYSIYILKSGEYVCIIGGGVQSAAISMFYTLMEENISGRNF